MINQDIIDEQHAEITRLRAHIDDIVPKWAAARDEIDRLRAECDTTQERLVRLDAEITRLRTALAEAERERDEQKHLTAFVKRCLERAETESLEANLKLDEFLRRIWKAEADLAIARGALVEARYWWGEIRTEKEDIRTRAERAEADLATITSQRDTALETIAVWRSVIYALQADLAAAREVMTRVAGLIDSEADDPLQDAINMARAFLERTAEDKDFVIERAEADFATARGMAESILAFWAIVAFQRNHVIPECVVKARAFLERTNVTEHKKDPRDH